MITWPNDEKLTEVAKRNLSAFKKTAAAKQFEEDDRKWVFHSYARMADPPLRMILQDETSANEMQRPRVTVTMDERGVWFVQR